MLKQGDVTGVQGGVRDVVLTLAERIVRTTTDNTKTETYVKPAPSIRATPR